MSFSADLKAELFAIRPERDCCRLTELSAGQLEMVPAGEEFLPGPREEAK